jgi:hypothetical protein
MGDMKILGKKQTYNVYVLLKTLADFNWCFSVEFLLQKWPAFTVFAISGIVWLARWMCF